MINIKIKQINEKYGDGRAELIQKDTGKKILIALPELGEDGIKVSHDKRLYEKHLEKVYPNPIYIDEIRINITGWFYIFHELIIQANKEYTYITILNK